MYFRLSSVRKSAKVVRLRPSQHVENNVFSVAQPRAASLTPTQVKISPSLAACMETLRITNGLVAVTSITAPSAEHFAERGWKDTIWGGPDLSLVPPLIVYHEDIWDTGHGRHALDRSAFPNLPNGMCFVDIFDAAPMLLDYVKNDPMWEAFYSFPGTLSLSEVIMDGKALVRKFVAISHAIEHAKSDGDIVLWMDVDVYVRKSLDDAAGAFFQFINSRDVTYIAETPCYSAIDDSVKTLDDLKAISPYCLDFRLETGIFALRVGSSVRAVIERGRELYEGGMLELAREAKDKPNAFESWRAHTLGLNDIYVFAAALHDIPFVRHGWFSNIPGSNCHERASHDNDRLFSSGFCDACVANSPGALVAPFPLDSYARHFHRGAGVMASQHSGAKHYGAKKRHKPRDPEMLLPEGFEPVGSHIDPRCACRDRHADWVPPEKLDAAGVTQCRRHANGEFVKAKRPRSG